MGKSTENYLRHCEARINGELRGIGFDFNFSIKGHNIRQRNSFKLLKKFNKITPAKIASVHKGFKTINDESKSVLCVYERCRIMFAVYAHTCRLFLACLKRKTPVYFVTLIFPQHHVELGQLHSVGARRIKRKLDDGMRQLKLTYPNAFGVSVLEIAAYEDRNATIQFHPHTHAIISGAPWHAINKVFTSRKLTAQRRGLKPVLVKRLNGKKEICHQLLYMAKIKPHLSYPYENSNAGNGRRDRIMPEEYRVEWLQWMSNLKPMELLGFHNLSRSRVNKIGYGEMETIIEGFLVISKQVNSGI